MTTEEPPIPDFRLSEWYYLDEKSEPVSNTVEYTYIQLGPFSADDLKDDYDEGVISLDTKLSQQKEPIDSFKSLKDLSDLVAYLTDGTYEQPIVALDAQLVAEEQDPESDLIENERKRKWREEMEKHNTPIGGVEPPLKKKRKKATKTQQPFNSSVYVTGLPKEISIEDVVIFFEKCGQIKLDNVTAIPKVKFYLDDQNQPRGDALITYFREPSVELAMTLLDETEIKPGFKIKIEPAKFEKEKEKEKKTGPQIHTKTKKKKVKPVVDQARMLQWGLTQERFEDKPKIVVLKHMFHPDDFTTDPLLKQELRDDIQQECNKFGVVERVRVFEDNPDGVVEVRFIEHTAAEECIEKLNGRYFGGRSVKAEMWDMHTNYNVKETAEEIEQRHNRFGKMLEQGDKDDDSD